jgi:nicotinamide-nucleotide amidase
MTKEAAAKELSRLLAAREEKIVFAESCTAGMVAATLGQIPGISEHMCGSFVTYREAAKTGWLGLKPKLTKKYTTESPEVAEAMAVAALERTPEADWAMAVVGHLGPNAPEEKDGTIWVCCARRTSKGKLKIKDATKYTCHRQDREDRQEEAVEVALTTIARAMHQKDKGDGKAGDEKPKRPKAPERVVAVG